MSTARNRKEGAKRLGIALHQRYERLVTASGEDAIVVATTDLAQCMYENVEFIIWLLKDFGGLEPPLPDPLKPNATIMPHPQPVPTMPAIFSAGSDTDLFRKK